MLKFRQIAFPTYLADVHRENYLTRWETGRNQVLFLSAHFIHTKSVLVYQDRIHFGLHLLQLMFPKFTLPQNKWLKKFFYAVYNDSLSIAERPPTAGNDRVTRRCPGQHLTLRLFNLQPNIGLTSEPQIRHKVAEFKYVGLLLSHTPWWYSILLLVKITSTEIVN